MTADTKLLSAVRAAAPSTWRSLIVLGLILVVGGAVLTPSRLAPGFLLYGYLLLGIAIGGLYFLTIHYAARAGWATVFKRLPEAMTHLLPVGLVLILLAFIVGAARIYPWFHAGELHAGTESVPLAPFKAWWLSSPFFFLRAALYAALLLGFGWALRRSSVAQDRDRDPAHTARCQKLAVSFLVIGSFVVWLTSFDWIMSLEPHWYSTIFGVYNFAGHFTGALAVIILLIVGLERRGALPGVNRHHLHDLGKLLFAMCTFWMYMWFSQAMLIWYGNIAEEAVYFNTRLAGGWRSLFIANVLLNWIIPFLVLLSRRAKRSPRVMVRIAIVVLAGRWLDVYLMIYPPIVGTPTLGFLEIGGIFGAVGLTGFLVFRWLNRVSECPVGDPYLAESLHFHQ